MKSLSSFDLRWTWLFSMLTLAACQSIQGSWYFQKEPSRQPLSEGCDRESRLCLYLNVTNISNANFRANKIRVFTHLPPGLPFTDRPEALWECDYRGAPDGGYKWSPGKTVVLTLPHKGDAACMIPMDAQLDVRERKHPVRIRITGNQPSSIPTAWLSCSRWSSEADGGGGVTASHANRQAVMATTSEDVVSGSEPKDENEEKEQMKPQELVKMLFECRTSESTMMPGGSAPSADQRGPGIATLGTFGEMSLPKPERPRN
jgi:hypothetical protein